MVVQWRPRQSGRVRGRTRNRPQTVQRLALDLAAALLAYSQQAAVFRVGLRPPLIQTIVANPDAAMPGWEKRQHRGQFARALPRDRGLARILRAVIGNEIPE